MLFHFSNLFVFFQTSPSIAGKYFFYENGNIPFEWVQKRFQVNYLISIHITPLKYFLTKIIFISKIIYLKIVSFLCLMFHFRVGGVVGWICLWILLWHRKTCVEVGETLVFFSFNAIFLLQSKYNLTSLKTLFI